MSNEGNTFFHQTFHCFDLYVKLKGTMDVSDLEELWKKSPFFDYCAPILKDDYEFSCTKLLERIEKIVSYI